MCQLDRTHTTAFGKLFPRRNFLQGGALFMAALAAATAAAHSTASQYPRKKEKHMEIRKAGSQPSAKGSADWFTGSVRIDMLFAAPDPALVSSASVTFEPGARTAWHTHPLGQTLIVTSGAGWVQRDGGQIEHVFPGDVVWFPPHEKHWHGATATNGMTHIAIQEKKDGRNVDWMEHVSDQQYNSR